MHHGNQRAQTVLPLAESEEDVQEDDEQREYGCVLRSVSEIIRNRAVDFIVLVDGVVNTRNRQSFRQRRLDQFVLIWVRVVDHVIGHDAQLGVAVLRLNNGIAHFTFFGESRRQGLADLLHIHFFGERDVKRGSAREFNAILQAFGHQTGQTAGD